MEKILRREDGSRVKINISLNQFYPKFNVYVSFCPFGKRIFQNVVCTYSSEYRRKIGKEREEYIYNEYLQYVTLDELENAKKEYIEKEISKFDFSFC